MSRNYKKEIEGLAFDYATKKYQLELDTSMGKILLDMYPDVAPGHCTNMLGLAKLGFYDGLIFHRIVKGFVIQGGCPEGVGTGGPGFKIKAEFSKILHEPGILSMARSNDPDSGGSQFFLCLEKAAFLDGKYTVFGKTHDSASLDVVRAIGATKTGSDDRPTEDVKINKATVLEK